MTWLYDDFGFTEFAGTFEPDVIAPSEVIQPAPYRFRAGDIYVVPRRSVISDESARVFIHTPPVRKVVV